MIGFLEANLGTILILAVLLLIVFFAIRSIVKSKKAGKSSCGCNCGSCAMSGSCHGK